MLPHQEGSSHPILSRKVPGIQHKVYNNSALQLKLKIPVLAFANSLFDEGLVATYVIETSCFADRAS
jgi:hypothetical protein